MRRPRCLWYLNLDAEYELASPSPERYTTNSKLRLHLDQNISRIRGLLGPDDRVMLPGDKVHREGRGCLGRAWCPTPRALREIRQAGATIPEAPELAILKRVNSREFSSTALSLGREERLDGEGFATSAVQAWAILDSPSISGKWLAKRAFGVAGRGQRKFEPMSSIHPVARKEDDVRWVEASLRLGGIQLEPLVTLEEEFVTHGEVPKRGDVRLGEPCIQVCGPSGEWGETRKPRHGEMKDRLRVQLLDGAAKAGSALRAAGYFGPFGVDAFTWRTPSNERRLRVVSEINARYTMGWSLGMPTTKSSGDDQ